MVLHFIGDGDVDEYTTLFLSSSFTPHVDAKIIIFSVYKGNLGFWSEPKLLIFLRGNPIITRIKLPILFFTPFCLKSQDLTL